MVLPLNDMKNVRSEGGSGMPLATLAAPILPPLLPDRACENSNGAGDIVAALKHDAPPALARHVPNSLGDAPSAACGTRTPNGPIARFDWPGVDAGVVGADGAPHAPTLIRHTNATIHRVERMRRLLQMPSRPVSGHLNTPAVSLTPKTIVLRST
jgi:hypothetical protein